MGLVPPHSPIYSYSHLMPPWVAWSLLASLAQIFYASEPPGRKGIAILSSGPRYAARISPPAAPLVDATREALGDAVINGFSSSANLPAFSSCVALLCLICLLFVLYIAQLTTFIIPSITTNICHCLSPAASQSCEDARCNEPMVASIL
jgi:hypothetical protein